MILIFKGLLAKGDLAARASLGLTCSSLYRILKYVDPEPMRLWNIANPPPWPSWPLGSLSPDHPSPEAVEGLLRVVAEFLGDKYRGVWAGRRIKKFNMGGHYRSYHFLHIEVYGENGSEAERKFKNRMDAYVEFHAMEFASSKLVRLVPCPLGIGNDWYREVQPFKSSLPYFDLRKFIFVEPPRWELLDD